MTVEMTFRETFEKKGTDLNWRELLTEEIEYGYAVADKVMALVDDDKLDWKPETGDNWMNTGQLLKHIATCCGPTFSGFVTGDWRMPADFDPKDMKPEDMLPPAETLPTIDNVAAARNELADDKQLTLDMLAKVPDEDLDNKPAPAPWDPRPTILGHRLLSMVLHIAQHKGQLYYYLKLQGKPVNTSDLWGM
jgi:uncharacterized damage-inducible protein DinB